jgi:integrase
VSTSLVLAPNSQSVLYAPEGQDVNLSGTGTVARKRAVRMGSRYQNGTIQTRGNWVYLLYRIDTPDGRKQVAERLCPASGEGSLSKAERRRKAHEVLVSKGINKEHKMIEANLGTTFRQQAKWFIEHAQTRTRKPVAASTIESWQSCIDKWLDPAIGNLPLSQINNAVAKNLISKMVQGGLSAKSISTYFGLVKMVVASAVNDEGEEMFERKWNHEFIELPEVDSTEQHRPTFSSENINLMLNNSDDDKLRMLIVLAAASGMRLGEILGLSERNVSNDGTIVTVAEKAFRGEVQDYLKTKNAERQVDLDPAVGKMLREFIGDRKGLVFCTRTGKPISQSNLLKRQLHPLLKELKMEICGAHAFRRFRTTHLRKQRTPEGLVQSWLGHAGKSQTDGYDRVREDVEYRKEVAQSVGIGFVVPTIVVRSVREFGEKEISSTAEIACPA